MTPRGRRPLRVTFLVANYSPSVGGAQELVRRIAEGLVARHDCDVEVVTTDALRSPGGSDAGRIDVGDDVLGGVRVLRRPVARRLHTVVRLGRRVLVRAGVRFPPRPSSFIAGPLGIGWFWTAARAARRSDVAVGVAVPFLTLAAADLATRRSPATYVALPLTHVDAGTPSPWMMDSLRRAAGVVAATTFERDWLIERGVGSDVVTVLPPGCDVARYPSMTPPEARGRLGLPDRPTVGYIGRLAAEKGIDTLLEAVPPLLERHPDLTVLLAGSPVGWGRFDEIVAECAAVAGDRLVVHGRFTDDDKPLLFAACDIVAFPSRVESFGMVTLEAWAARRPVVAAHIESVACVVRTGVDGDLVPPSDPSALAAALGALLDDPDRRRRYGDTGRARVEQEFTWDGVIDRWAAFLDDTARAGRGRVTSRVGD